VAQTAFDDRIRAVRQFSRFYTRQIGLLNDGFLGSHFSLVEGRVLYELAHRDESTAKEIGEYLGLDAGYLSRILARFAKSRLIQRERSREDARHVALRLTKKGHAAFEPLNRQSSKQVAEMLNGLSEQEQMKLVDSMLEVERALSGDNRRDPTVMFRSHRTGDIGWVIHRHGILYAQEYGWDESFEALVAEIAGQFIRNFDSQCERCWIAERDGERLGSVFLVKYTDDVAKLRMLLVEPHARGLGIGRRLVDECVQFARASGYRKVILWTQSILTAARNIYQRAGFKLVKEEPQLAFGADLVSETWEMEL
jgi:DNA-binding MarR family transcriptional regulator/N-acetylglutamate synthase-like GNAT family acetyltransferase